MSDIPAGLYSGLYLDLGKEFEKCGDDIELVRKPLVEWPPCLGSRGQLRVAVASRRSIWLSVPASRGRQRHAAPGGGTAGLIAGMLESEPPGYSTTI